MRRHVRFGIFLAPFHALDENPVLAIERDFELVEWLDRLDYDEAWIGEHHSGGFEIIACPEMFIAAAAERTRRIRFGTGVVSLPYHHPFMIADRILQLDYMTPGARDVRVGPGALTADAGQDGDPGRGAAPPDGRGGLRPRSAPSRRDGEPQDGLVRAPRRLPPRWSATPSRWWRWRSPRRARRSGRGRPESTASVCSPSAARPTPALPRTPRTGRPARPSRPRTATGRTVPAGGWSP